MKIRRIIKLLKQDPNKFFKICIIRIISTPMLGIILTPKFCVNLLYLIKMGKKLNLISPQTFNEKLQWLKLNDRNPFYTKLVDKYEVRDYISKAIGDEYLIPLLGVYSKAEEIDFNALPNQFVLKSTHDSGGVIICKEKDKLDIEATKKRINKCLKKNYYFYGREWPYKNVKPRIICEKYMVDESGNELKDYKVFCFNGEPKIIQVDYNRFVEHKRNLYNTDWEYIPASIQYPSDSEIQIKKPDKLKTMLKLSKILSKDYSHVRIDFYLIEDKIYFGEITFYHESGFGKFQPEEFGLVMGNWIKLNDKN